VKGEVTCKLCIFSNSFDSDVVLMGFLSFATVEDPVIMQSSSSGSGDKLMGMHPLDCRFSVK